MSWSMSSGVIRISNRWGFLPRPGLTNDQENASGNAAAMVSRYFVRFAPRQLAPHRLHTSVDVTCVMPQCIRSRRVSTRTCSRSQRSRAYCGGQDDIVAVGDQCEMSDIAATPNTANMMHFLVRRNIAKENVVHHAMNALHFPLSVHPSVLLPVRSTIIE